MIPAQIRLTYIYINSGSRYVLLGKPDLHESHPCNYVSKYRAMSKACWTLSIHVAASGGASNCTTNGTTSSNDKSGSGELLRRICEAELGKQG